MRGEQACLKQHCGTNFFFLLHNSQYRFLAARPALGEMEKPAFGGLRSFTGNLPLPSTAHNNKRDSDNGASRLNNSLCEGTGLIFVTGRFSQCMEHQQQPVFTEDCLNYKLAKRTPLGILIFIQSQITFSGEMRLMSIKIPHNRHPTTLERQKCRAIL